MTVCVLIREDQNEHGYIDTSIAGVFQSEALARQHEEQERRRVAAQGLIVESDDSPDGDWQVSWKREVHDVR